MKAEMEEVSFEDLEEGDLITNGKEIGFVISKDYTNLHDHQFAKVKWFVFNSWAEVFKIGTRKERFYEHQCNLDEKRFHRIIIKTGGKGR